MYFVIIISAAMLFYFAYKLFNNSDDIVDIPDTIDEVSDLIDANRCLKGCVKPTSINGNCKTDIITDENGNCFKECPYTCPNAFDECQYDHLCSTCGFEQIEVQCL